MDALGVQVKKQEFLVDVLKTVAIIVDLPFGNPIVFLTVGAAVIVQITLKACTFLITFVPLAAKGTALHSTSTITILVQLIVYHHIIHFLVLYLVIDVHQDDVSLDILGALARQFHVFVSFQERLLQVYVYSVRNFAFLDFIKDFFGRHHHHLVAFLDGIAQLVADIVQALLYVDMNRIGPTRYKVHTDAHIPLAGAVS